MNASVTKGQTPTNGTYHVRTRYGWGWEVWGPAGASYPIEFASAAQAFADARNAGLDHIAAAKQAGIEFASGRWYVRRAAKGEK